MKKITGILMATTLSVTLALTSISCASTPANTTKPITTTPIKTTPPITTAPPTTSTPPITTTPAEIIGQKTAEEFIKNSSTFKFDGIEGSIKFVEDQTVVLSSTGRSLLVYEFQTAHPGHGDRTGQVLAQVITTHKVSVLIDTEKDAVISASCDNTWDMIANKDLPVTISGYVISGGDTSPADGPTDTPRTFTYKVQKADGTFVYVSYTAYPPSPVGDAQKEKITLEFYNGEIKAGDKIEALGMLDKETSTIKIANQGDYIRTYAPKLEIVGKVIEGGDTTPADGPQDAPRTFAYKIQKEDGTIIKITYTAYPPSPAGDEARNKITLSYYDGEPEAGDYMKAYGTFDVTTGTIKVSDQGDFIKTYPEKP